MIEVGKTSLAPADRVEFFRTLGNWLSSGGGQMPVAEAIRFTCESFGRDEYRTLQPRMERITQEVQSGQTPFYQALASANLGFKRQELAIVEAAEKSNQMRQALPNLVDALNTKLQARKSLFRQLAMPLFAGLLLVIMSIGVITVMMPTILQPVLERDTDALADMPFVIGWYWAASQWLQVYWPIPAIAIFVLVLIGIFRNVPILKPYTEAAFLGFAPTRRLIIAYNATLVVYFMPALLRSGLAPHEVFRILADSLETLRISGALRVAANEYESGTHLVDSVATVPFRSSFRSSLEAGEKTGAIADRVDDLKLPYHSELERVIRQTVVALTTLVMAVLLPMFLLSMYITLTVPIFALMEY